MKTASILEGSAIVFNSMMESTAKADGYNIQETKCEETLVTYDLPNAPQSQKDNIQSLAKYKNHSSHGCCPLTSELF